MKTSWNNEQLQKLINPNNHRIKFNGVEFDWDHKINGVWETHSIYKYKDSNKHYSNLYFWLNAWSNELQSRNKITVRNMKKQTRIEKKAIKIKDSNLNTEGKIKTIKELLPSSTIDTIATILNVSIITVKRHLLKLKKSR
tara:strand:- start:6366 stop:6785 length:420 start_codon:yes stop_codon:yes gene_type:complete